MWARFAEKVASAINMAESIAFAAAMWQFPRELPQLDERVATIVDANLETTATICIKVAQYRGKVATHRPFWSPNLIRTGQ
jgi:hypothetical protein